MTITFNQATGQLSVNGPIDQTMLCYAMLGRARDVVQQRADHPVTSKIAVPKLMVNGRAG